MDPRESLSSWLRATAGAPLPSQKQPRIRREPIEHTPLVKGLTVTPTVQRWVTPEGFIFRTRRAAVRYSGAAVLITFRGAPVVRASRLAG